MSSSTHSSRSRSRSRSPLRVDESKERRRSRSRSPFKREKKTRSTPDDHKVCVKPSKVAGAGDGLFAVFDIKRGTRIIGYLGDDLTPLQYERKYPNADSTYTLFCRRRGVYIDATCVEKSSMGRYANCATNGFKSNARYTETGFIVATRKIFAGDEILVSCGNTFRKNFTKGAAAAAAAAPAPVTMSVTTELGSVEAYEKDPTVAAETVVAALMLAAAAPWPVAAGAIAQTQKPLIAAVPPLTVEQIQNVAMHKAMALFHDAVSSLSRDGGGGVERCRSLRAEARAVLGKAESEIASRALAVSS